MRVSQTEENVHPNVQTSRTLQQTPPAECSKPTIDPTTPEQGSQALYDPASLSPLDSSKSATPFPWTPINPIRSNELLQNPIDPSLFPQVPDLLGRDSYLIAKIIKNIIVNRSPVEIARYIYNSILVLTDFSTIYFFFKMIYHHTFL